MLKFETIKNRSVALVDQFGGSHYNLICSIAMEVPNPIYLYGFNPSNFNKIVSNRVTIIEDSFTGTCSPGDIIFIKDPMTETKIPDTTKYLYDNLMLHNKCTIVIIVDEVAKLGRIRGIASLLIDCGRDTIFDRITKETRVVPTRNIPVMSPDWNIKDHLNTLTIIAGPSYPDKTPITLNIVNRNIESFNKIVLYGDKHLSEIYKKIYPLAVIGKDVSDIEHEEAGTCVIILEDEIPKVDVIFRLRQTKVTVIVETFESISKFPSLCSIIIAEADRTQEELRENAGVKEFIPGVFGTGVPGVFGTGVPESWCRKDGTVFYSHSIEQCKKLHEVLCKDGEFVVTDDAEVIESLLKTPLDNANTTATGTIVFEDKNGVIKIYDDKIFTVDTRAYAVEDKQIVCVIVEKEAIVVEKLQRILEMKKEIIRLKKEIEDLGIVM